MLTCPIQNIAALLPHSAQMVLLDEIVHYDKQSLCARSQIYPNCILLPKEAKRLPSYLGLEIMAQGIAAWAGIQALNQGKNVRLGFLLGSRKLEILQPDIALETPLLIHIQLSLQDQTGMGVFEAKLEYETKQKTILQGKLSVFSPPQSQQELI